MVSYTARRLLRTMAERPGTKAPLSSPHVAELVAAGYLRPGKDGAVATLAGRLAANPWRPAGRRIALLDAELTGFKPLAYMGRLKAYPDSSRLATLAAKHGYRLLARGWLITPLDRDTAKTGVTRLALKALKLIKGPEGSLTYGCYLLLKAAESLNPELEMKARRLLKTLNRREAVRLAEEVLRRAQALET